MFSACEVSIEQVVDGGQSGRCAQSDGRVCANHEERHGQFEESQKEQEQIEGNERRVNET